MASLTQANRQFKVSTPLGNDVLLFGHMSASEQLSGLYKIDLNLFSTDRSIKAEDILGTPVGVSIELLDATAEAERHFHGHVAEFAYVEPIGNIHAYRATLRPWLWFLTRTADCRIFQRKKVPDIIKSVFRDLGFTDFREDLSRGYEAWEYCVQYRETAFDFVSRLMEHEGIYYYFEHTAGKHTLVLTDSSHSHLKTRGYESIPYYPPEQSGRRKRDHISQWWAAWEVQSGQYTHTDYDFTKPALDLATKSNNPRRHGLAKGEVHDYPGAYTESDLGGRLANIRLEELRSRYQVLHGIGNAQGLAVGALFELTGFPRDDQNREYLITSTTCEASSNDYATSGNAEGESSFDCSFTAMSSDEQFRPPRVTPEPFVHGPQTAVVVGPGGEEIYTDEHGRIKVRFHWDRAKSGRVGPTNVDNGNTIADTTKDEDASCWIRVGQLWASSGWGSMWIPRIGMEVIVDFLEGDPDQPIVTGCVYNGTNKPPYALPAEKTKSTIKSNSSKGGGGSNEMRFEDKKGSEEIYIHAQKDRNLVIEHDETKKVGNDRKKDIAHDETTHVGHDRTETVDNNETITIGANRTETVQKDETITINGNRTEQVAKEESITIGGGRTENVGKDESITIGASRTESVGKDESISIGGARTETVAKDESVTISGARTLSISKDDSETVSKSRTVSIGKTLSIDVTDEITITCGSASINMKKNGDITINGKAINIKGSGDVTVKGQKILQN
jgi:type VI secretion system secreted protein VgrG